MGAAAFGVFFPAGREGRAGPRTSDGAVGAFEERASVSVPAEVAKAVCADKVAERSDGVLRCQGDSADSGAGGYGSAESVVDRHE